MIHFSIIVLRNVLAELSYNRAINDSEIDFTSTCSISKRIIRPVSPFQTVYCMNLFLLRMECPLLGNRFRMIYNQETAKCSPEQIVRSICQRWTRRI